MAQGKQDQDRTFTEIGIPSGGMDTDTVPRLLPPTKAPLLKNFLMDRPGILPMRGPICEGTTWNFGASIGLLGGWDFDDKLLISCAEAHATRTRDYWVAPYRFETDSGGSHLRRGNTTLKHIDLATNTVTDVAATNRFYVPGHHGARVGTYVYGVGADADSAVRHIRWGGPDTYEHYRQFLRWDGTAATPVLYTHAPKEAQDVLPHLERLFVLGGTDQGGGTSSEPNSLRWSDPFPGDGSALPDAATSWQDDVSGLDNKIIVGSDNGHDFGVALAHVGANLCILKRRSLWVLYGTQPANFSVKQADNEVGCIDPRSVVEYNGGVYFMSERGYMFFDGGRLQNASPGLNSTLVANARKQAGPQGVDGGYVRAAQIGPGYILVTTGAMDGATLTTTADSDAWLLHAPTGAWQQLSSGALGSIVAGGSTLNQAYLMTDTKLAKANYLFNLAGAPASTRGFDSIDSGATKFVIPSRWTTRALPLGSPARKSKLQRIVADYYWSLANGGWQITTNTRGETGVVNSAGTVAAPASIGSALPARGAIDVFNETDEAYLDIAASSGAPATFDSAELHRVIVETRATHPVKSAL